MTTDRRTPIEGPNMGVEVVQGDTEGVDYFFIKDKAKVTVAKPAAVRLKREGGNYYMVEFFYKPNQGPRGMEIYDGKSFVLVNTEMVKKGRKTEEKKTGRLFENLFCVGRLRDTLTEFPDVRFDKYVCQTASMDEWNDTARHLEGLGVPLEETE